MSSTQHLTQRAFVAGFWLTFYRFFAKFIGLIKTSIVARILTPTQFGVFGVVSIALNLFETFSEIGIEQALIHQKKVSASDVTTAWLVTLCRSLIVSAVLFFSAPLFASFFEIPETKLFIQAIAFTPILRSLRNPQLVFLKKELDFRKESFMLSAGSLAEVVVGITATLAMRNVWGLVLSIFAGAIAELIASYIFIPWPRWAKPNFKSLKTQLAFGRWIWASSALSYAVNQGDDIIVGKLLGAAPLGLYQNAFKLASLPATQISGTITQVTFPAFASIQEDKVRLKRAFRKSLYLTSLITVPFSVFTIIFAWPLTLIIFGDQWLGLVPALRVLSVFGAIRSVTAILGPLSTAIGKPEYITMNGIIRTVVLFALIIPMSSQWGLVGASWATVISISSATVVLLWLLRPHLKD